MRILYICADPGVPLFGRKGCSTHVRENCLTLARMGHEVRILCTNADGDEEGREELDVRVIEPYRSKKLGFDLRHILNDRRVRAAARRVAAEWKPDALYERYSLYSLTGTALAGELDLPHLLEVNAFMTEEQSERIKLLPLARACENRIMRRARHVIVVSDPLEEKMRELRGSGENITRMPMGVNIHRFNTEVDGSEVRRELGIESEFVIGYVGTLTGWHGINLFYSLARTLRERGMEDFVILAVGGDERRLRNHREKVARNELENHIRFAGAVPHREVPKWIRAMDAALVPDTTPWSSPAKLFEYQGCGVPVLAPDYPAIRRAMTHESEGLIFEPGNFERMADCVLRLAADPEGRRAMGLRGHERASADHSWEAQAEAIIGIYRGQTPTAASG